MNNNDYMNLLKEKIKYVDDSELVYLIEKLIEERENLINVTIIDPLTGVYNKSILNYIRDYSCVIMCDIDNFKLVNDKYGHLKGDYVIREVAKILYNNFRTKDCVCRFGGDEFLIIVEQCDIKILLERLQSIKDEINKNSILFELGVTLSIGVSSINNNDTLNDLIETADVALYESKKNGKNCISVYDGVNIKKC